MPHELMHANNHHRAKNSPVKTGDERCRCRTSTDAIRARHDVADAASVKATDSCHATLMAREVCRLDAPAAVAPVAACPARRPLV